MTAPELCRDALSDALDESGLGADAVDYLIGHTTSPHTLLPPNVSWVADALRYDGPYLELRQACTGFASALQIAHGLITGGAVSTVAVVGSEVGSPYCELSEAFMDLEQLVNYVQMGDGAASALLGPDDGGDTEVVSDIFVGQIGLDRIPRHSPRRRRFREPGRARWPPRPPPPRR